MSERRERGAVAFVVLLGVALAGAACGKKNSTPTETFRAFYTAAKKKDAAGMKRTMSKKLLAEVEEMAKRRQRSFDEFLVDINLPDTMPEVSNERIEGDRATLEIQGRSRPGKFVREDGEWKLASDSD